MQCTPQWGKVTEHITEEAICLRPPKRRVSDDGMDQMSPYPVLVFGRILIHATFESFIDCGNAQGMPS